MGFKTEYTAFHYPQGIKEAPLFTSISLMAYYYTAGLALFLNKAGFYLVCVYGLFSPVAPVAMIIPLAELWEPLVPLAGSVTLLMEGDCEGHRVPN